MEEQWYYTVDQSDRKGPVSLEDLLAMIREGRVQGADLAWTADMSDWQPVNRIARLSGALAGGAGGAGAASTSAAPISSGPGNPLGPAGLPEGLLGWMNFVGIFTLISGVLNLCNLLIGIFLIFAGLALLGARTALLEIPRIDPVMLPFMEKLRSFMKMMGIFYIVTLVLTAVIMVVYMFMIFAMIGTAGMSSM